MPCPFAVFAMNQSKFVCVVVAKLALVCHVTRCFSQDNHKSFADWWWDSAILTVLSRHRSPFHFNTAVYFVAVRAGRPWLRGWHNFGRNSRLRSSVVGDAFRGIGAPPSQHAERRSRSPHRVASGTLVHHVARLAVVVHDVAIRGWPRRGAPVAHTAYAAVEHEQHDQSCGEKVHHAEFHRVRGWLGNQGETMAQTQCKRTT